MLQCGCLRGIHKKDGAKEKKRYRSNEKQRQERQRERETDLHPAIRVAYTK